MIRTGLSGHGDWAQTKPVRQARKIPAQKRMAYRQVLSRGISKWFIVISVLKLMGQGFMQM
jgi:hypothetical protein